MQRKHLQNDVSDDDIFAEILKELNQDQNYLSDCAEYSSFNDATGLTPLRVDREEFFLNDDAATVSSTSFINVNL